MGNLIIKGKGGAGNKLILQDQAGAAVLTTADSGATIASGVTGGSGLDALSASNLSAGTVPDARFPAALPAIDGGALTGNVGKVLQCVTTTSGVTSTGNQAGGSWYTGQEVTFTPISTNSTIHIYTNGSYQEYNNASGNSNMNFLNRIFLDNSTNLVESSTHNNYYADTSTHVVKDHSLGASFQNNSIASRNIKFQAYGDGSHRVEYRTIYGLFMYIMEVAN